MKDASTLCRLTPSFRMTLRPYSQKPELNTQEPFHNYRMRSNRLNQAPNLLKVFPIQNSYIRSKMLQEKVLTGKRNELRTTFQPGTCLNKSFPLRVGIRICSKKSKVDLKENIDKSTQEEKNKVWKALIRCVAQRTPFKHINNNVRKRNKVPLQINISLPKINGNAANSSVKHPIVRYNDFQMKTHWYNENAISLNESFTCS